MEIHSGQTALGGNASLGHPSLQQGPPLTHKEGSVALSWVIGTLSLAVIELSVLQSKGEHILRQERDRVRCSRPGVLSRQGGQRQSTALTM